MVKKQLSKDIKVFAVVFIVPENWVSISKITWDSVMYIDCILVLIDF